MTTGPSKASIYSLWRPSWKYGSTHPCIGIFMQMHWFPMRTWLSGAHQIEIVSAAHEKLLFSQSHIRGPNRNTENRDMLTDQRLFGFDQTDDFDWVLLLLQHTIWHLWQSGLKVSPSYGVVDKQETLWWKCTIKHCWRQWRHYFKIPSMEALNHPTLIDLTLNRGKSPFFLTFLSWTSSKFPIKMEFAVLADKLLLDTALGINSCLWNSKSTHLKVSIIDSCKLQAQRITVTAANQF